MIMLVLIGLTSCLVQVTKVNNMKVNKRLANESAIQSTFGEYSNILQNKYGIFALDISYMQAQYSLDNIIERYGYYGGSKDDMAIDTIQMLSDNGGSAFKEQVIAYMEAQYGLDYIENIIGDLGRWEALDLEQETAQEGVAQGSSQLDELNQALSESEEEGASELLKDFKMVDLDVIYSLVTKDLDVSDAALELSQLASNRQLNKGFGDSYIGVYNSVTEKALLLDYIGRVFPNAQSEVAEQDELGEVVQGGTDELKYQMEYLIEGKGDDQANIQGVIHKLLLLRSPLNYAYLNTDTVRKSEVRVLSTTLSLASGGTVPEEAIYQALL